LTGPKALLNNRPVRKALAWPAAALAAVFLLGISDQAIARPARSKPAARSRHDSRKKPALATGTSKRHRAKTKTVIRQNHRGKVIVERVGTRTAALLTPQAPVPVSNPPGELQNFPPAPCYPVDVVLEAHVHETPPVDAAASGADLSEEGDAPPEAIAPAVRHTGARGSLGRMAARVGSLFRPKSGESEVRPADVDLTELISADFIIPVEGVDAQRLRDSFLASRGRYAKHLAIDIGAPRGTPILATTDGEIVRTAKERRGGNTIYQKDATGQYLLFYCHLSRYAGDMAAGRKVKKGEVIGYVGSTGHVIGGPHLHFSITRLPDGDDFRKGLAINPYLLFLAGVP
jgi:murein DD-endopeptidase MepM/ murein hydrolase activator NlpD